MFVPRSSFPSVFYKVFFLLMTLKSTRDTNKVRACLTLRTWHFIWCPVEEFCQLSVLEIDLSSFTLTTNLQTLCIFKTIYHFIVLCKDVNLGKNRQIQETTLRQYPTYLVFFPPILPPTKLSSVSIFLEAVAAFCRMLFFLFCIVSRNKTELSWASRWISHNLLIFSNNSGPRPLNVIKIAIGKL